MNKRVWVFQYSKEVQKKGAKQASWYVGWYDFAGKRHSESCGPGSRGKNKAEKRHRRIQSELDIGVHQVQSKKTWKDFRREYVDFITARLERQSVTAIKTALHAFERHIKPGKMEMITTKVVDHFVALRRQDQGKKPKSKLSPATINKDLRHIKAALNRASEWGYLSTMPKIRMVKEPIKIPRYVTAEHFELIYKKACPLAKLPTGDGQDFTPEQWWKAIVVTAYMTGLRIGELISLRRGDLDFERKSLITRADDNKGSRDEMLPLHPIVIQHILDLNTSLPFPLGWPHDLWRLWPEFGRIQKAAGIHLPCHDNHEHTDACHVYGFHDFRRAFATVNAPQMKPETLQKVMRHKSYKTTLGYINLVNQVEDAVANMPVPDILNRESESADKRRQIDSDSDEKDK